MKATILALLATGLALQPGVTGLLKVTSKGCSSQCQEGWQDHYVAKKNVTCCSADLCNARGPSAPQLPVGPLGLLTLLGGLLLCGPGQL